MSASRAIGTGLLICLIGVGCGGGNGGGDPDAAPPRETLEPEPAGAPTGMATNDEPDLGCIGQAIDPAPTAAVELTGYVRALTDPTAVSEAPNVEITAFTSSGAELGGGFTDLTKAGRVAFSVAIAESGFTGYVEVAGEGFLPYRFETNHPRTTPDFDAYAWLITADDVTAWEATLDITQEDGNGILFGGVHDCQDFALENVVIQVNNSTDGIYYPSGPTPATCPTGQACAQDFAASAPGAYSNGTGRFFMANVPAGAVTVKAFGRLESGGPLTLIGAVQTQVVDGGVTAVGILPDRF